MIKFILDGSIDLASVDIRAAKLTHGEHGLAGKPPLPPTTETNEPFSQIRLTKPIYKFISDL